MSLSVASAGERPATVSTILSREAYLKSPSVPTTRTPSSAARKNGTGDAFPLPSRFLLCDAVRSSMPFLAANLTSSKLDRALFSACDMRAADLRRSEGGPPATTRGATFEDCDLRETSWDGRDLTEARFVRCKLGAMTGRPASTSGVTILEPDSSLLGDGADIGDAARVLALWAHRG
jgi:uncharacterized protein YjbI with pentapeptide repeats